MRRHCLGGSISQRQQQQHQAHAQELFHCHRCHTEFMLAHFFPCKVSPKPALSLQKFGVVPAAGSDAAGA